MCANAVPTGGALEISRKDFEQSIERDVDIVFPADPKAAAQAAKLGKPLAEIATGKLAQPFAKLSNMVLSHASEDGADMPTTEGGSKASIMDGLKNMLQKPKAEAA